VAVLIYVCAVLSVGSGCLSTPAPAAAADAGSDEPDSLGAPYDAGYDGGQTDFDEHRLCVIGGPIDSAAHMCAASVCERAPSCCTTQWFSECVDLVELECDRHCSTGVATASHGAMAMGTRNSPGSWTSVASVPYENWVIETSWADIDGDGDADVAMGRYCGARIYRNDGYIDSALQLELVLDLELDDSAGCWRMNMEWGDADDDGDVDLAVSGLVGLRIIENRGKSAAPQFAEMPPLEDSLFILGLDWMDYNGDGDADLFAAAYEAPTRLYRNTDGALVHEAGWVGPSQVSEMRSCHVDANPRAPSLLALRGLRHVELYRNQGASIATTPDWSVMAPAGDYYDIACGDLDGDGVAEVVAVTRNEVTEMDWLGVGHVRVLSPADGQVLWTSPEMFYGGNIDLGDINGDGRLDIVVAADPPGATAETPEPFHVFLTDAGESLQLTEEPGADFVPESDTTRIELVDLSAAE
jgi:hypothetical protein